MNSTTAALEAHEQHRLSHALRPRHVTMITIGGIIGAGLFVGSSVAIAAVGPAVIVTYAITGLMFLLVIPVHAIAYWLTVRDARFVDVILTRLGRCPMTRNRRFWGGDSYAP